MTIIPRLTKRNLAILIVFLVIPALYVLSQKAQPINLNLIPQRKVREYIVDKSINSMDNFSAIHASWKKGTDESLFQKHEKVFYVKDKLEDVWNCYTSANPIESWNGHFVRFGLLISKYKNKVIYSNNTGFSEVDTGQVYFLDLRLLKGLFNIPVAFEITTIDTLNKIVEFSYIDGNKSQGKQVIQFLDNGDGTTRIVHRSFFKSDSHFRDEFIYPYFHAKIIREFHHNMRRLIQRMLKKRILQKEPGEVL